MKVYIYKHKDTEFQDDWLFAADMGFKKLGAKVLYFEDINTIPYAPDNIVVGYVEDTRDYFDLHGVKYPAPLNIPDELNKKSYLSRNVSIVPLSTAKKSSGVSMFIKPHEKVKQFESGVIKDATMLEYLLMDIPDSTWVLCSEVIDFKSEYRCFVYEGKLVGMKHYQGDYLEYPNPWWINDMIKSYTLAPIAYSLDIGVIDNSHTSEIHNVALVECNDFWSIGHYGLDSVIYAKMLRDRWFQLTEYRK